MFHLSGFYQNLQIVAGGSKINAIPDPALTTAGSDIRVPAGLPYIMGVKASCNDASYTQAELQSPSLRALLNLDIEPIDAAALPVADYTENMWAGGPAAVAPNENLNLLNYGAPAGAVDNYGFVWFADGPQQPVKGPFYTVRCTAVTGAGAAKGVWVNQPLVIGQALPAGSYQVCGMRARGATLVAARLVFVGTGAQGWRPGVLANQTISKTSIGAFRFGAYGVFGQFDNTTPPTVDLIDSANETVEILLDLVKVK